MQPVSAIRRPNRLQRWRADSGLSQRRIATCSDEWREPGALRQRLHYCIYVYTIKMDISFDSAKSEENLLARGIPFELAAEFEWDGALIAEDLRKDYGERRFQALGLF